MKRYSKYCLYYQNLVNQTVKKCHIMCMATRPTLARNSRGAGKKEGESFQGFLGVSLGNLADKNEYLCKVTNSHVIQLLRGAVKKYV